MTPTSCDYCHGRALFTLEWYGLNQYGKKPVVVGEMGLCGEFEHAVPMATSREFWDFYFGKFGDLDGVTDVATNEQEYPQLARLINEIRANPLDSRLLLIGQSRIDDILTPNQLKLF